MARRSVQQVAAAVCMLLLTFTGAVWSGASAQTVTPVHARFVNKAIVVHAVLLAHVGRVAVIVRYKVLPGDSLSAIALGKYGSYKDWPVIYSANRNAIKNPNLIYPGQVFTIPKMPKVIPAPPETDSPAPRHVSIPSKQSSGIKTGNVVTSSYGYSGPQGIAAGMLSTYGWSVSGQMGCLIALWNQESGWRWDADNPGSGAYGIPQALPASKMSSAGSDWLTNPATQIKWGLTYILSVYGSPCAAEGHEQQDMWY